jgi:GNAT superfamily N-acetyltransferase
MARRYRRQDRRDDGRLIPAQLPLCNVMRGPTRGSLAFNTFNEGGNIVADKAETTITLTDAPDDDESAVIADGLRAYNEAQAGYQDSRPLAVLVSDAETKKVVGGLLGRTSLGLLRVERFFLPEQSRRGRLGSRILATAEEEARRRGCTRAVLSTIHFQAPGFYLKQGWEVAARIECEPPGHTRFYMTKKLS